MSKIVYEILDPTLTRRVPDEQNVHRPAPAGAMRPAAPPPGLGDLVERYAKPIAARLDRWTAHLPPRFRTHLNGCSACSLRRRFLNIVVPAYRSWPSWRRAPVRLVTAWRQVYSKPAPGPR
jgi:hypothetical protein